MIYINLLPVRDIKRLIKAKKQILIGFLIVVFVLVGFALIELLQLNSINSLKEEDRKLVAEKQQYINIVAEIKKMENEKNLLVKKIDVINQLKQSSSLTVHVLDEIANLTPHGRMWLKSLSQNEQQVDITGLALDEQTIAKFMDDLENSPFIHNVILAKTVMELYAERNLKLFTISCQVAMPKLK